MVLNETEKRELIAILTERAGNVRSAILDEKAAFKYGMINDNNNCYINSISQCLFGLGPMINSFVESVKNLRPVMHKHPDFHVLGMFFHLIQFNYDGGSTFKNMHLNKIVEALVFLITSQKYIDGTSIFEEKKQQDASEFFGWFINYLDESVACLVGLERELRPEESIKDMFRLDFVQKTICEYGHVNEYRNHEITLNLRVPRNDDTSLQDLISEYFGTKIMNTQEDNKYNCIGCKNKLVGARQSLLLENFPTYLVIVLNRACFEVNYFNLTILQLIVPTK